MGIKIPAQRVIISTHLVPSNSVRGDYHQVRVWSDGTTDCDCIATMYKKPCVHAKKVLEGIKLPLADKNV